MTITPGHRCPQHDDGLHARCSCDTAPVSPNPGQSYEAFIESKAGASPPEPDVPREWCRNWIDSKYNRCGKPADCIVWGKLLPPETLGPLCYDCAEGHFGYRNVHDRDGRGYAIYHLRGVFRGSARNEPT